MSTYHIQYHVPVWVEVEVYEPVSDGDEVEVEAEVLRVVVDDGALQGGPGSTTKISSASTRTEI